MAAQQPRVRNRNSYRTVSMDAAAFLAALETASTGAAQFLYYSGELERTPVLVPDVVPLEPFVLSRQTSVNVWIGAGGVTAHTHYDSFHNFFVQIRGTKTFLMFPPEAAALQPFPFLHPSHAQSQQDIFAVGPEAAGAFAGWRADLEPGDVLYLPPCWWHCVVATSLSVSVNIWSEAEDSATMAQLLGAGSVRLGAVPEAHRAAALVLFLQLFAVRVARRASFVAELYQIRCGESAARAL
eukprot:TRINITY_DN2033_c0_g3_i1.p3 TRINITY_DN2033_c0_g3~~TRINITY_DN2033_c0_g3_i1.p3  ORF type:complete len:240 (-),score=67.47 TRINITY_DN2033_c0_g3_i1:293-1012(-)